MTGQAARPASHAPSPAASATEFEVLYRGARAALDERRPAVAVRLFQLCLDRDPTHVKALSGLSVALFQCGEYERADEVVKQALALDDRHLVSLLMKGHLSRMLADPVGARRYYEAALRVGRHRDDVDSGLPHLRVAMGDPRGWKAFSPGAASVQLFPDRSWTPPPERVWQGEVDPGAIVCVYRDGGNGDLFFFSRFIRRISARVGQVYLTASAQNLRLLERLPGLTGIVKDPDDLPEARFVHLWSLPGIFQDGSGYAESGYIPVPDGGPLLPERTRFRVGLAWAGNPNTPINPDRSVPDVSLLRGLFQVPSVEWVSLQVGYRQEEAAKLPGVLQPEVRDFADTARLLAELDLVITVDTAVANLAGALGIPGWIMVPTYPELRWGTEGEHTPWYPSLRLFRRAHTRAWQDLIDRIAAALSLEVERRSLPS